MGEQMNILHRNSPARRPLLVLAPFPPPVHGFAVIMAAICAEIEKERPVLQGNLSSAATGGLRRHLVQAALCLRGVGQILRLRLHGGREVAIGANGGWGLAYTLMLVASARLAGLRICLHHHSYAYILRPRWLMAAICAAGGHRLEHVFLAASMEQAFHAHYPRGRKAHVLPNAVFVPPQPGDPPPSRSALRVGLISNLSAEKGLYDFIETARQLKAAGLPVEMVLAGPAALAQDRAAIATAEAQGLLRATGPLYGAEKTAFFRSLDLFLFPTRYENEAQPTVIYEAFATGVPVLAFRRGAIGEQVGECLASLPNDADFAEATLKACRDLLSCDPHRRAALREAALARLANDAAQGRHAIRRLYLTTDA